MKRRISTLLQLLILLALCACGLTKTSPSPLPSPTATKKIPVLAIFGDQDRQMDPLQVAAYRSALAQAGNPMSRVALLPKANHGMVVSESGCPEEDQRGIEQYVRNRGYASVNEALAALLKDPDNSGLLSAYPCAPGYLDMMEESLRGLGR
jgi:predicted small lipoprotein YifL